MYEFIVKLLISLYISWYLRSQQDPPTPPPPAKIDESGIPLCEEGVPIPVLFGRRQISSPNVLWYVPWVALPIEDTVDTK